MGRVRRAYGKLKGPGGCSAPILIGTIADRTQNVRTDERRHNIAVGPVAVN